MSSFVVPDDDDEVDGHVRKRQSFCLMVMEEPELREHDVCGVNFCLRSSTIG